MLRYLKRRWKDSDVGRSIRPEGASDPKVRLEQSIRQAHEQHRRLKDQAVNVIANHEQTGIRLNQALEELERTEANARQAVLMAAEATSRDDPEKAASYTQAAEQFSNRLLTLEQEIESLRSLHLQATDAANQAKAAVAESGASLRARLTEHLGLLGQLDRAKMQARVDVAVAALSEQIGEDLATLDEVRDDIDARWASAKRAAELVESGVETRRREVEQATRNVEARARLAQIMAQLGVGTGPGDTAPPPDDDGHEGRITRSSA